MSETVRRLAAINKASRAMNSILDPEKLLDTILSLVEDVFHLDTCAILLFEPESRVLRVEAARGYLPEVVESFRAESGQGLTGHVFASGDPVIVNNVDEWEGYVEGVAGARSEMAAPLRIDQQVIGVLDAESCRAGAFQESDLDLFRIFANQAATAIKNASLVRRLERRSRELEKKVDELAMLDRLGRQMSSNLSLDSLLHEVLHLAQKTLRFDHCALLLKEEREDEPVLVLRAVLGYRDEVKPGLSIRAGEGITGRVLKTGKPILIPDVRINGRYIEGVAGGRCEMAAPLTVRGKTIGVLDAEAMEPNAFSEMNLKLFATFASWVAQALDNAETHGRLDKKRVQLQAHVEEIDRMNEELRRYAKKIESTNLDLKKRVRELETLQEASQAITSSLDLDETLAAIVDMTREIVDSSSCAIRLLDDQGDGLAQVGEGKGIVVGDPPQEPLGMSENTQVARAELAVPLTIGQKVIGYFELGSIHQSTFSQDDRRVLQVLASQAAIAIENARLFENTQQTYYETIKSLAQALEARDSYTRGHSERVTQYALAVADEMDLSKHSRKVLHYAGMLHDIGKIGIADSILHKRLKLTSEEWDTIRSHPLFGDTILGPIKFLSDAQQIVLRHHERYDGSGYPGRLRGEEIPLEARIIAVADAYDAMTSDRPYRKALEKSVAINEISRAAGQQFDPQVVDAFLVAIAKL